MAGIDWEKGSLSSPQRPVADSGVDWESGVISSAEPEKSSLARRLIGDTAVSAVKGAIGLTEVPVGIADMATGGMAGKALEGIGYRPKEAKAMLDEMYSPEQKAANKAVSDAEGFLGTAKAALQNPSTIGQSVIESAPLLLPGAAIARGAGAAGKIAPVVAGGIGEGVVGAGLAAEQMRQNSEDGMLSARQTGAALVSGAGTAAFGTAGGKLAQSAIGKKLGLADVDTALATSPAQRAAAGGIDAGIAKRIAGGAVSEGVLEELPQSMWEQAVQNYGEGKPIGEGVAEAGAMGALAGGVMGGGFNALQGRMRGTIEQQPPAQEAPRALPAPTYTGTPSDQTIAAEVERANQVAAAQANADAIYAERAAFEQERAPAKLPVTGPLSAAVNVGIDSGATSITSPANPRYEIPAQPRGSFAQLDELASLIGQERADVADRRELAQLVGQERRDQERRIAEAADSRRALDAALADTDRRAAGVAAQESEAARLRLLDNILSSVSDTGNPARQFGNALRRAGYRNTDFTERERQVIQRFSDARAALRSPEATTIPSAPNELDAASLGIRERSTAGATQDASGRDKIGEAVSLLSQGWKLALNKTLVSPTGKKRKLNAEEFAAVREARAKMINKTEAGNAATKVDAVSDQGRGDVAAGGIRNAQPVRSIARGRSGNAGAPVQGMRAAGAVGNAGGAGSALNAAQPEQVAQEAAQADGAQAAPTGDQIAIKSASPSAATIPAKSPAENQNRIKKAAPIMRRDDLVGAIMRVTGGNGIAANMAQTIIGDKANQATKVRGLFQNAGTMDLDDTADLLRTQEGYDVRDGNHLAELIREQAAGNSVVSMERAERDAADNAEKEYRAAVNERAASMGLKRSSGKRTLQMVEADIARVEAEIEAKEREISDMEAREERAAIQAESVYDEIFGADLNESDWMTWLSANVAGAYTQEEIDNVDRIQADREDARTAANADGAADIEAQAGTGVRKGTGANEAQPGGTGGRARGATEGFSLTRQTNDQAAEQFARQQAGEPEAPTKEQADRERDAVPFSMQQQSQPKPQGVQTGLFTADGRVSSGAAVADVSKTPKKTNTSGEPVQKTAENEHVESADKLDPAKIRAGYAHRSLGGLGDKVKLEQMWFDKASEAFAEKVGEKAESEEQKALAAKLLDDFKAEYKTRRYRVMRVGETVVSSAVAGRNKFNAAQAGRRGSALDRAEQEFTDWQKGAIESGVRAIRAARSPEQIAAEQQAKADKAAKKKADLHALLGKLLDFKKGDGTLFGKYPVARVSLDKSGYPSSVTVNATDLTDNKFDIARILFDGDKDKLRAAVDEIRASRTVAEEQPSDSVRQNFESRSASPADAEFSATERAYGGRESYDRAKAAGKTKLNYRQWVQVRTPKFKEWFGDWEMATSDVRRLAATFSEAREQARAFQGKPLTNGATGIVATVSRNGLDKMLSAKAVGKSETPAVHSMAVANLDALFERALLGWSKQDSKGDPNIKAVHRFFSPVTVDGRAMLAKMTVKETAQESKSNPLYTVEAVSFEEMENPAAQWVGEMAGADGIDPRTIRSAGLIESMAERVKKFNPANVSKVVDPETGEPLVVYHGTTADINEFRPAGGRPGEWQKALDHFKKAQNNNDRYGYMNFRDGSFFSPKPEYAGNYTGENSGVMYQAFVVARNPVYFDMSRKHAASGIDPDKTPDALMLYSGDKSNLNEIAVIDPTQVKSAAGNNGNFDGGNPDIRESRADGDLFSGIAATVLQDEVLYGAGSGPNGTGNFGVTRTVGPHGERLISIPVDLLRTTNGDPSGPKSGIQVGRIGADNTGNRSQRDARSVNIDRLIDIVRYLPSAVPSPWRSDAAALESKPNGRPMQASHGISDLLIGGPLLSHLKRLIDVPGQRISVMKPGVIFGGQNFKIVDGVIQSIPVDMMNVFVSGKTAAGVSFHNQPVFILPSDSLIENVALLDDISSALRPSYASGFGHSTPSHKNTLKVRRYNDLVKKFKDLYAGASALDIRVVATREEIPDRYRPSIYAEGVYHQETGLVYLVASNVDSDNRLMQILMHEAIGHYGLANMMGDQFSSLLETVLKRAVSSQPLNRNPQPGEANYETVDAVRRLYPEASDAEVAQEVLARMAETMPNVGWFRMAMARIMVWLKNAAKAFGLKLEPTMADVRRLVELAGYHVRSGANLERSPAGRDAVFASRGTAMESRAATIGRNESVIDQMRNAGRRMAGADWSVSEPSKIDDLIYSLQDKQIDLKRVIQSIAATGKKIGDDINAYLQEELFHGRAAKGVKDFLDFELRPLLREMQMLGIDMGDFEEYLWNRHAEERNNQIAKINPDMPDGGSGINTADARAYLAELSADQKRKMEALAARIDQMNRNSQRILVESGLEKQETIDAWNGAYKHYVPLQREDVDSGHVGTGKGFSVRGSSSKRAMGSGKKVVDIIANLTQQRERNIVRAEKNRVSNALFGLAAQNPNPDFWKVDEAPKERVVQETAIYTVLDADGNKIDEFTRMAEAERLANKTPGATIDQSWADRVTERIVPGFKNRDNVILTRIGGEDHYVILNERDDRAMRLSAAMKNLDMDNMGRALSIVGKATRYLASVNTQYNPVFGVINLIRDVQGALLNLQSTQLAGEQKRVAGYTVDALRGIYADIRAHRRGENPSSKLAELFEEFQKEGGQTGYRDQYANAEARAEAIMSELNQFKEGKLKLGARAVFGWLSDYNETMENAVRLAAYKTAKEKGLSNQQAASIAKNLTVNFNRKGQMTTQIGALYAFFNASVQGTARMAETLFEKNDGDAKKIRLSKLGKRIISGGIMLGSMQAMLLAAAGFDDDEPPEFVRERNLILPTGDGKYLTLAMPLGFHVIPGIGRIATEFALSGFKDPAKRIVSMFGMFAETFNPVGSSGFSIQTLTPSIVDPFAALAENRDFTGREIYRENFNANDPAPGHTRAKDVATPWSRYLSESINFITGGTDFKPGAFSPSPDAIDYLIAQATGGVGREINKAAQTVGAAYTGDDLPLYKIPLVGRFVGDTEGQSGISQKFYNAIREINAHDREVKGLRESGRVIEAQEYIADNPVYRMRLFANLVENQVRKLRDARRKASDDGDSDRVRAINDQITRMMTEFNERAVPLINQSSTEF